MPHLPHAQHETSKHDSPHEIRIKVKQSKYPEFKLKPHQVNDSSQSNQETGHLVSQSLSLDESIDNRKHKVWCLNPRPHEDQKDKKAQEDHLEEGKTARSTKSTKSDKPRKRGKKSSKSKNLKLPLALSMQSLPLR
jgi:hypothetical protein